MTTLTSFGLDEPPQDDRIRGILIGTVKTFQEARELADRERRKDNYMRTVHIFPPDEFGKIKVVMEATR